MMLNFGKACLSGLAGYGFYSFFYTMFGHDKAEQVNSLRMLIAFLAIGILGELIGLFKKNKNLKIREIK